MMVRLIDDVNQQICKQNHALALLAAERNKRLLRIPIDDFRKIKADIVYRFLKENLV